MEKLILAKKSLLRALDTLPKALEALEKIQKTNEQDLILFLQDACIKRFEYCYDSFWKVLKKYLESAYNLEDVNSPRSTFKECVLRNVCDKKEGDILLEMIVARNITSHNYSLEQIRKILPDIPLYYRTMKEITDRIEEKQK